MYHLYYGVCFTDHFNKALDIMNRAVSGHFQPGAKENMAYFAHTERRHMADTSGPPPPPPPPPPPSISTDVCTPFHLLHPSLLLDLGINLKLILLRYPQILLDDIYTCIQMCELSTRVQFNMIFIIFFYDFFYHKRFSHTIAKKTFVQN